MGNGRCWWGQGYAGIFLGLVCLQGGLGCAGSGQGAPLTGGGAAGHDGADAAEQPPATDAAGPPPAGAADAGAAADAADAADVSAASTCPAPAAPADLCKGLPGGTMNACGHDSAGQPSPHGYLEILGSDGSRKYVCASWVAGPDSAYWFDSPDRFVADPQSCCGASATPVAGPTAPPPAFGYLGVLHAPVDIKAQETPQPGVGLIRQNPFAVILRDSSGGAAFSAALTVWQSWQGDGQAHPAPDGSGAYYFPGHVLINYAILETDSAELVVVIGPEVSLTADGSAPLGHPTLGACAAGGGAPLALIAGELSGKTLTNHSGRFGHDPSVTPDALNHAAALLNCFGVPIAATKYYAPKP